MLGASTSGAIEAANAPTGGWTSVRNPESGSTHVIYGIACPTTTMCTAVGDAALTTTDGGRTWTRRPVSNLVGDDEGSLSSVSCPDTTTCIAVQLGFDHIFARTGVHNAWHEVGDNAAAIGFGSISCATSKFCMAVGWGATPGVGVVTTRDGGRHWTLRLNPSAGHDPFYPQSLNGVSCISAERCVVVGDGIMHTVDGGASWTLDYRPPEGMDAITCPTSSSCYMVGYSGGVYVTHNGGKTWNKRSASTRHRLWSIACWTATRCIAVGEKGTILATMDAGNTWLSQRSGTNASLQGVACTPSGRCYAVGEKGTILEATP